MVNTVVPEEWRGSALSVGDEVTIEGVETLDGELY